MADSVARVWAVASMTLREALRRKVLIAALVMTAGFLALYGFAAHEAGDSFRAVTAGNSAAELMNRIASVQLLSLGLTPAAFIVGLAAVFASVGIISSELDTGVMYGVLSRPVRRAELVIGKAVGVSLMLAAYSLLTCGAVVGLARWQMGTPLANLPGALALFALEPVTLIALAVLGSTRLPTLANGVLCTIAYGIAFIGGVIEQIGGLIQSSTMVDLGIASSLLMPVDAVHRKAISILMPGGLLLGDPGSMGGGGMGLGSPSMPSIWMLLYAALYVGLIMWAACRAFARRDL